MDKVVQQNAASAEESASASEEMNAQANQMKLIVRDLTSLIQKNTAQAADTSPDNAVKFQVSQSELIQKADNKPQKKRSNEVNPSQVIPFDNDDDFKDF